MGVFFSQAGVAVSVPAEIRMLARWKFLSCTFIAVIASPYCIWLTASADRPLWADESITVQLVKSVSLKHMVSAILLGLDATPPLYTGYAWLMLHYVVPVVSPELLLRVTNAGLIGAALWILYLSIRHYFDQTTSLMTISLFIILEMAQLKFLTLEVRTYAAFVLFTMLTIYTALRAVARPHWIRLISTALASCMLVSSHTFGIVYAVSIASCAVAAAAIEGKVRVAFKLGLTSVPAIVMFCLWVPILKQQAQLGNWIPRPDLQRLLDSTYPPSNSLRLEGIAIILALVIVIWPRTQNSYGTVARRQWWRATNGIYIFAIAIPIAFG